jgi:hypothetical protein
MKPGQWVRDVKLSDGPEGQVLNVREWWGQSGQRPTWLLVQWRGEAGPRSVALEAVEFVREGPERIVVVSLPVSALVQLVDAAFSAEGEGQADAACSRNLVEALGAEWTGMEPW